MTELKLNKTIDTNKFYKEIDSLVKKHNLKYIDAVVYFCEKNEIEIETAASMISNNYRIKSSLQLEGEELHFLPRTAKLPI
jgi:virulence-associated protein VapD